MSFFPPVPDAIARLFSAFPLHTFPAAACHPPLPPSSVRAQLVVPRPRRDLRARDAPGDSAALRWTFEAELRGLPLDIVELDFAEDAWGAQDAPPFLIAPHGRLVVPTAGLDTYFSTHAPFEWERAERPESHSRAAVQGPWSSPAQAAQAHALAALLETDLQAGVLQAQAALPDPSSSARPLLSRAAHAHRLSPARRARAQAAKLAPLAPTASVPGWEWSLAGLLGGSGVLSTGAAEEEEEEEEQLEWDPVAALARAREAVAAVAQMVEPEGWCCGASSATPLDALLFAQLHTLLSLPLPPGISGGAEPGSLREELLRHPSLIAWARRVYAERRRKAQ